VPKWSLFVSTGRSVNVADLLHAAQRGHYRSAEAAVSASSRLILCQ